MVRAIQLKDYVQIEHINHKMTAKEIKETLKKYTILVFIEEDMVRGYVIYKLNTNAYEIDTVFVDVLYRREGIGTSLLSDVLTRMKRTGKKSMTTSTKDTNLVAHLFLKAMGFIGRIAEDDSSYYDFEFTPGKKQLIED